MACSHPTLVAGAPVVTVGSDRCAPVCTHVAPSSQSPFAWRYGETWTPCSMVSRSLVSCTQWMPDTMNPEASAPCASLGEVHFRPHLQESGTRYATLPLDGTIHNPSTQGPLASHLVAGESQLTAALGGLVVASCCQARDSGKHCPPHAHRRAHTASHRCAARVQRWRRSPLTLSSFQGCCLSAKHGRREGRDGRVMRRPGMYVADHMLHHLRKKRRSTIRASLAAAADQQTTAWQRRSRPAHRRDGKVQ